MELDLACQAITSARCPTLNYHGFSRVVEVHAVGLTSDGRATMRVWQVRGGSNSGESPGWKLMKLDETLSASIIDEPSQAPRDRYKRGDSALHPIYCEV